VAVASSFGVSVTKPSVLVLDDREGLVASSPGIARMRGFADVRILTGSLDQLTETELAGVHVLLAIRERTRLDAATLARMPSLELILQTGGHAYHVDADYTSSHGIPVTLSRGAFGPTAAVPELTFALAVAALRLIPAAHRSMVEGEWLPFMGRTLSGRTLGILGVGRHGANVARIGKAYGMRVVAWQRTPDSAADDVPMLELDELLSSSDVVSIHLKLSGESRGLLDAEKLALMKPGSVLINTARGAIVEEPALVAALRSGPLSAAGLDVFAEEPLPADSPLRSLNNVVLTPHIGWTVEEVLVEWVDIAARQLEQYLAGNLPRKELLDPAVVRPAGVAGGLAAQSA
jgi:phosphoglycerate dehydrogenase-like enzyme